MPSCAPSNETPIASYQWARRVRAIAALRQPATDTSDIHVGLSNPDSLYIRGLAHYQKAEYAAAEKLFNAVIQLRWHFPVAHLMLGNIAAENKDFASALERYEAVLEIDPYEPTAYYNLALTHADLKDYPNERLCLEKALTVSPGYSPAYFELAKLLCAANQTRDAISLLIRSAYKAPTNADALVQAGKLYYDSTFYKQAEKCFQRALKLDPWHQDAHLHLGIVQFRNGQCGLATLSFAHCLNRNPKHKLARAFQKLASNCLLKLAHPEFQAKPTRRKAVAQTSFPFTNSPHEALSRQ